MFRSRFLTQAADRNPIIATPTHRSMLFAARAAMRCYAVPESPFISPMTAALVAVAKQRTECPEVPSASALATADVESGTEAQDVVSTTAVRKVTKSGRKRKNEVPGAARRRRVSRKKDGTGVAGSGSATDGAQFENSG